MVEILFKREYNVNNSYNKRISRKKGQNGTKSSYTRKIETGN